MGPAGRQANHQQVPWRRSIDSVSEKGPGLSSGLGLVLMIGCRYLRAFKVTQAKSGWLLYWWFRPSTSTQAKVGRRPQICHPDRSVAQWRDLRFVLMETEPGGDSPMAHSPMPESRTAGPSTALRSGRDDKFEGGGSPWLGWRRMDRVKQRRSPESAGPTGQGEKS
jgi:hypothetical protein